MKAANRCILPVPGKNLDLETEIIKMLQKSRLTYDKSQTVYGYNSKVWVVKCIHSTI